MCVQHLITHRAVWRLFSCFIRRHDKNKHLSTLLNNKGEFIGCCFLSKSGALARARGGPHSPAEHGAVLWDQALALSGPWSIPRNHCTSVHSLFTLELPDIVHYFSNIIVIFLNIIHRQSFKSPVGLPGS